MRDIVLEETIYLDFTTRSFTTGVPTVLAGTPVLSALEENNATPITAGVSVSVDRASVVGLNMATIVATAANGYENGKGYSVYISTGTVGGVSVVGEKVAEFTIGASAAAQDLANGTDGLGAIKADTAATLVDTAEIGTAGAGLTDLGGMSTAMKAEVNAECDTALTDYDAPTNTEMNARTLPSASYFDPAADTVANVTTVATTTNLTNLPSIPANWITAAGIAASALDGKGDWNIGKTGYSISGTITTLDGLNNFDPATDAVANVTLCATTTTNTDMRGTDNAFLAASAPTNFSALGINVGGDISVVTLVDTTTANTDMRGTDNALLAASINLTGGAVDTVTDITNDVGITQAGADKVWASTSRTLTDGIQKNTAFNNLEFLMVLASDHVTPATGLTVTGQRSIDGGAFGAVSGVIAEVSNGIYQIDLLAADTNGAVITYRFSSGTADDTFITVTTA